MTTVWLEGLFQSLTNALVFKHFCKREEIRICQIKLFVFHPICDGLGACDILQDDLRTLLHTSYQINVTRVKQLGFVSVLVMA